ncbi:MAG: zinc ribbon domain-containing protein [bacterium]
MKGNWFLNRREGVDVYPRKMVQDVESRYFLLGCTVTVRLGAGDQPGVELKFENCGKPEGETVQKILAREAEIVRCPECDRELTGDFAFCPFCKANLKRLCPYCRNPMQPEWLSCPFCGK